LLRNGEAVFSGLDDALAFVKERHGTCSLNVA
jgi:hypothetical protein